MAALIAVVLTAAAVAPSNCRLYVVAQYDWGRKLGFYLDFEGSELKSLPVILGLADGANWRFARYVPGFEFGGVYDLRAEVAPDGGRIFVDGRKMAEVEGPWKPAEGARLDVCDRPSWASEPGDWMAMPLRIAVRVLRGGKVIQRKAWDFPELKKMPPALYLFQPDRHIRDELVLREGDTVVIEARIRFEQADPLKWAPLVDRYGQCRYADWPGKIRSDQDLRREIDREDQRLAELGEPKDFDRWGGYKQAGWREKPTGFYRVVQRDGFWWLVTPEGNPCFYVGMDSCPAITWPTTPVSGRERLYEWLPPREKPWAAAWSANHWGISDGTEYVCFHTCNLIRKYGPENWADEGIRRCIRRLRAFAFSGCGKWGAARGMPETPVLWAPNTPKLAGHPDVFDPKVRGAFEKDLRARIEPRVNDPAVVGWSFGNEITEIIKRDEVKKILAMGADVPAKRALVDYALGEIYGRSVERMAKAWKVTARSVRELYAAKPQPPAEDVEKLRLFYEDRYWAFVYQAVKRIDPNHLFLSVWLVPGWWESEDDWGVAARHCDVLGYDRYAMDFADERVRRLFAEAGKPVLCGEFSFPAWYDGWRGYGRYGVAARDDVESGELYYRWVRDAAREPHCVGVMWFQYRDQPITGRGPGRGLRATFGEHFAFGIITVTDQVKWDLALKMREANLRAPRWRLEAMHRGR